MTITIQGLGKITANKDVLNNLCAMLNCEPELFFGEVMIKEAKRVSSIIYEELDKSGFYDDVKESLRESTKVI